VQDAETAIKLPSLVLATTTPFVVKKPPFVAREPVLTSKEKLTFVGAGVGLPSFSQLDAKPPIHAGIKTEAAPIPTLAKNSFLVMMCCRLNFDLLKTKQVFKKIPYLFL
jgi:hypothetical protein